MTPGRRIDRCSTTAEVQVQRAGQPRAIAMAGRTNAGRAASEGGLPALASATGAPRCRYSQRDFSGDCKHVEVAMHGVAGVHACLAPHQCE